MRGLGDFLIGDKCYCPFLCQLESGGSFYTASTRRMKQLLYPVTVICWDFVFLSVDASSVFFVRSDKMRRVLGILLVCTALRFLSFLFFFLKFFLSFNTVLSLCRAISSAVFAKEKEKEKKKSKWWCHHAPSVPMFPHLCSRRDVVNKMLGLPALYMETLLACFGFIQPAALGKQPVDFLWGRGWEGSTAKNGSQCCA